MSFHCRLPTHDVRILFPTFCLEQTFDDVEEVNRDLETLIRTKRAHNTAGVRASNVGGWHGEADIFESSDRACQVVQERALVLVEQLAALYHPMAKHRHYSIVGWPVVNGPGHYQVAHVHPNQHFSGVYYVRSGTPSLAANPCNGALEFTDPRGAGPTIFNNRTISTEGARELVHPVDGLMVLFPAWCAHSVHVYSGESERIAIAFNVCALTEEQARLERGR